MEVEPDEELVRRIIRQVEYYFGDYNLPKDKWMLEKLSEIKDGTQQIIILPFTS